MTRDKVKFEWLASKMVMMRSLVCANKYRRLYSSPKDKKRVSEGSEDQGREDCYLRNHMFVLLPSYL